jgi:hypothetical protein
MSDIFYFDAIERSFNDIRVKGAGLGGVSPFSFSRQQ